MIFDITLDSNVKFYKNIDKQSYIVEISTDW